MPIVIPDILASGDDEVFKIVFFVIVGIIWVIASLVKSIKAKIEQAQVRARRDQLPVDVTARLVKPPPLPASQRASMPPGRRAGKGKRNQAAATPPLPRQVATEPAPVVRAVAATAHRPISGVLQSSLRQSLQLDALRKQVVMAEILGKPLALREE